MKRIYKHVAVAAGEGGFGVTLDGRPVRTPGRAPLTVASRALAEAIAEEWRAQGDTVEPETMPLTRLASTALDLVPARRPAIVGEAAAYAGTDLVCYRAEAPVELVARQQAAWQPLLDWAAGRYGAALAVTTGVVPRPQPPEALAALRRAVEAEDDLSLVALHAATVAAGSLVIALALLEGRIDAAEAFALSQLDETFQIERWGEDSEATRRRAALRDDLAHAARFHRLHRG
ncbi:MAG: ATP12 family chaperone protein [Candidatus Eiseniibacteriota bacterium]